MLYVSVENGGACATDCADTSLTNGNVIDCADRESVRAGYEQRLAAAAFTAAGGDEWTTIVDGRRITVTLLEYDDASIGPQPTEQRYIDRPGDLAGACSLVVSSVIDR